MSVLLALAAATGFGLSDFTAGVLSRRVSVFLVTLIGQSASLLLTWAVTPLAGGSITGVALAWGCVAGVASVGGGMFLYRGLARGRMSVVGPVSAVVTAAGSAVAGVALGDRPGVVAILGMIAACAAVGLVSATDALGPALAPGEVRRSLVNAVAAGCGFILFFVALHQAGSGAGLWPVALAQSAGLILVVCSVLAVAASGRVRITDLRRVFPHAILVGLLGGGATLAYFFAVHLGLLSVTAVIASLYPAATVVPAMLLLHERLRAVQTAGLALAAVSLVLLSV